MPISGIRKCVKERRANKEMHYKYYSDSLKHMKEDSVMEKLHAWDSADDRPVFKSKTGNHLLCVLGQVTNFHKTGLNICHRFL